MLGLNSSPASSLGLTLGPELKSSHPESIYDGLLTKDGEIRLLQIEPTDDPTTHITARLFKAPLDDHPRYEAVSYRWESTEDSHFIIVNEAKFPVMRNIISFLLEFRRQSHPSSPIFWIDSICINKSCINDRNEQVQLMGRIYSEASLVRIWIGTESERDEQAFALIRHCVPPWFRNSKSEDDLAAIIITNEAGTKAITKLLQRGYWNRMWIFQEIVLAKEAVVHCGKLQAPWSYFRRLDDVSSKHILWHAAQIEKPWILEFRKALLRIAHFCITSDEAQYTDNVLHPTRHLQCQDPRDKLYALRGVCKALKGIVEVDYSVSVRKVFTEFAKEMISEEGHLSVLLTAGLWSPLNGNDIDLPSWVPDLRGMGDVDIRYLAGAYTNFLDAERSASSCFHSLYPPQLGSFQETDGKSIFNVQAMVLGPIYSHRPLRGISHSEVDRRDLINSFCSSAKDGTRLSISRLRRFFDGLIFSDKTTSISHIRVDQYIKDRARKLILGFHEALCQLFGPDPAFLQDLEPFEDSDPSSQAFKSLHDGLKSYEPDDLYLNRVEFLTRAAETTERQPTALFLTLDGDLGIGPRRVLRGDMVCIVQGCRVPLILRPHVTYYRLVGPAYISGKMRAAWAGGGSEQTGFEPIQIV